MRSQVQILSSRQSHIKGFQLSENSLLFSGVEVYDGLLDRSEQEVVAKHLLILCLEIFFFLAEENQFTKPFPNPSHSTFTFPFDQNFEQNESISIEIFNLHGRLVWSIKDIYAPKNVNWDASSLSSGVYLYKIWSNDQLIQSDKLILIK